MSVPISISTAPYDGYEFPAVLDSMAACGVTFVEPAFDSGYTGTVDEATFNAWNAKQYRRWLDHSGLACHAFSTHMDLGQADAVDVFTRRMAFAAALGARVINTNAATRGNTDIFFDNIEKLAHAAEALDMVIGLENPGNGAPSLINTAEEGLELIAELGLSVVRMNYDPGNAASHRPGKINAVAAALAAIPACAYFHVKDLVVEDGWRFVPPGQGIIGYDRIMPALVKAGLPFGVELPLRVHRMPNGQPVRADEPVPLPEIEAAVKACLAYVARWVD
jgi:sugar phosphate isomerase/epimerase